MGKKRNVVKNPKKKDCLNAIMKIQKLRESQAVFEQECIKHDPIGKCQSASESNYGTVIESEKRKLGGCPKSFKKI
jgi:hypothetical protein